MTQLAQPGLDRDLRRALATSSINGLPEASLASLFEQTAQRHAKNIALTLGKEQMTYGELNIAASRVAAALLALDITPDSIVAIYVDRSFEMVIAMLGVIKAGAAYLPIDPNYPEARVRETLADAQPFALLTDRANARKFADTQPRTLVVKELLSTGLRKARSASQRLDHLAYVIYTSGSTGKPKGVMITHRNVLRLLQQTEPWFHFTERDVWTMFHSFAFDFSVWEMWGCLLSGGRMVIVPFDLSRSPDEFYALLSEQNVTVLNQTPTAFSLLMQAEARTTPRPLALRLVIFGGEALNLRSLVPWFDRHGDQLPQLINMYGITETTVHVTYRRIRSAEARTEVDSLIGEPIPDLRLHLLNDALLPVPEGEVGEIFIAGPGVARGYLNRPELTDERFIPDPLSEDGSRLYRSGDLARRRADGELIYLGRADRQVKINGFRIELGEIEAVLASFPGVAQVCVMPHTDSTGVQRLAAYIAPVEGELDSTSIARFADQRLPAHMRPGFYTQVAELPLNNNGKVDRDALPLPKQPAITQRPAAESTPASPREAQIAAIWRHVLQVRHVGLDDNFFDVGGSSLLLITLRTHLQMALNVAIPVTWLFEDTTIRSFAARLEREADEPVSNVLSGNKSQRQRESFARMRTLRGGAR